MEKVYTDVTKESESERLGKLYPIILAEYNPAYTQAYLEEKAFLENVFGDALLRISHIGSTAVPHLISKPTIDILLEIKKEAELAPFTEQLTRVGYFVNRPPRDIIMYVKGYGKFGFEGQVFHIHLREFADHNEFYFRDYLMAHPETAKEYGELKQRLQQTFQHDRDGYTDAKSEFVNKITKLARVELKDKYKLDQ